MNTNDNTHMPTPPPKDMFENQNQSSSEFKAIDLQAVNQQIERFLEYVLETRKDFESTGVQQEWINALKHQLEETLSAVRDYEITHANDAVPRTGVRGDVSEVVLRESNPKEFDAVVKEFTASSNAFQDYFEKQRAIKLGLQ